MLLYPREKISIREQWLVTSSKGWAKTTLIQKYCCPIKVFQRKKSRLFHRTAEFPACQISDYSTEPIKCLL